MAHILVVDDDDIIRRVLQTFLVKHGHEVDDAANGEEAIGLFVMHDHDLIIADLNMPIIGGVDLLNEVKSMSPNTPVIIITSSGTVDAAVECMKCGASDFVSKPLNMKSLIGTVNKCLSLAQKNEHDILPTHPGLSQIAGYTIHRIIGYGNFAVVYEASPASDKLPEKIALKVMRPDPTMAPFQREAVAKRFAREAEVASSIVHPNIVRVYDYSISYDTGVPYIALEYVDGVTLNRVDAAHLSYQEAIHVIKQVAEALSAIHAGGILHRDIKPRNILITTDYTAKLTDFGIVKTLDSGLTRSYSLIGTPQYMAPEVFNEHETDCRSDLFSLGIVAYELLVGRLPFNASTLASIAYDIIHAEPSMPSALIDDFPKSLEAIVMKSLRKDPDERYQSAVELVADLDAAMQNLP